MAADAHARRSPAVRALHFGKRRLRGDSFPTFTIDPNDPAFTATDDGLGDLSTDPALLPFTTTDTDATVDPATATDFPTDATDSTDFPTTTDDTSSLTSSSVISTTATPTPAISFPTTSPTTSSSTLAPTPTPSATNAASNADAASGSSKGISGGGIAAIVTILVIAFLGVVLFFVRKMYIRKRELKRGTWGAGAFAKRTEFIPEQGEKSYDNASGFMPGAGNSPSSPFAPSAFGHDFGHQTPIAPPPMSYNNNFSPLSVTPPSLSPGMGAAVGMERASAAPTPTDALIKCTFIPSLPDELSISTGETVRVVAEYDDGWAMCANARGEQGMVPLECLDQTRGRGSVGDIQQFQGQNDWRGSKRVSSLQPARY